MELKLPVSSTAPYPEYRAQAPNNLCAKAMLENIGGGQSEMTAIALGLFGSVTQEEISAKAAEYFHKIMIVEMHHLNLFCRAARQLGAEPRLWTQTGSSSYWSASCCPYRNQLPALLCTAAEGEVATIAQYRQQAEQLPDPGLCHLLNRIIADEEKHLIIYRRLYQEVCSPGGGQRRQGNDHTR